MNVPKLRFSGFEDEWARDRLNLIVEYERSYPLSRANEGNGDIYHIHYGDIHTNLPTIIDDASVSKLPSIKVKKEFSYLKKGDILVADASEDYKDLGKPICFSSSNKTVIAGLHTHRMSPDFKKIISEYLVRLFQTEKYIRFVFRMGTGVSVLGLSKSNLSKFNVNYPSLKEQHKIASFLKVLDDRIYKQEEKIGLLKEEKKGFMQKIFSRELRFKDENGKEFPKWEFKLIKEIAIVSMGHSPKGKAYSEDSSQTVLIQGNADLNKGKIIPRIYTSEITKLCEPNDIILSVRAPVGELAITDIKACIGRGVCLIRGENNDFIFFYLDYFNINQGWRRISQGSTFESINSSDIKSLSIPSPSSEEQKKISDFLKLMTNNIEKEKEKYQVLQNQKAGFMQQMFI